MPTKDKLTDRKIRSVKAGAKPIKLFDGGGLYLLVRPGGAKYWRLKYRIDGKEKLISLGVYPKRSLAAARKARDKAKEELDAGNDPSEQRKALKVARRFASANTFEAVAREWFAKRSRSWAASNSKKIMGRLEKDVFPEIGKDSISSLTGPRLLEVLRKVEERGAIESAHRIRQYMNSVFLYALQTHRTQANPTPHTGALEAWDCPGFPDTEIRWDDDLGGVRWADGDSRRSSSLRR